MKAINISLPCSYYHIRTFSYWYLAAQQLIRELHPISIFLWCRYHSNSPLSFLLLRCRCSAALCWISMKSINISLLCSYYHIRNFSYWYLAAPQLFRGLNLSNSYISFMPLSFRSHFLIPANYISLLCSFLANWIYLRNIDNMWLRFHSYLSFFCSCCSAIIRIYIRYLSLDALQLFDELYLFYLSVVTLSRRGIVFLLAANMALRCNIFHLHNFSYLFFAALQLSCELHFYLWMFRCYTAFLCKIKLSYWLLIEK